MREAHARNPGLRHSNAGQKKKCGHCGEEGHNKRACPQLKAAAAEAQAAAQAAAAEAEEAARQASLSRVIVIEVDEGGLEAGAHAAADNSPPPTSAAADETLAVHAVAAAAAAEVAGSSTAAMVAASSHEGSSAAAAPALHAVPQPQPQPQQPAEAAPQHPAALPTRQLGPGLELSLDGDFVYPLPASKEQCVAQAAQVRCGGCSCLGWSVMSGAAGRGGSRTVPAAAAGCRLPKPFCRGTAAAALKPAGTPRAPPPMQAVLRAWDDGIRRQGVELLLPQGGQPLEGGGGWPGGIRQQFRAAKPMVEGLLLRLKAHAGLQGRITGELLDEGDCVGACVWCLRACRRWDPEGGGGVGFFASACVWGRAGAARRPPADWRTPPSLPRPALPQPPGRASAWARCCSPPQTRLPTCGTWTTRSGGWVGCGHGPRVQLRGAGGGWY